VIAIAAAELRLLVRNRLVASCAILFPFAFGAALYFTRSPHEGGGSAAGVQVVAMAAMGTYVTAATTLATRRQTLYLKRMRGAAISDRSIIIGLLAPLIAVNLAQIAIVLGMLASASGTPANPALLIAAIAIAEAMFTGLALGTAGFTASPEQAQYTTVPIFLTATAAAVWAQAPGVNNLTVLTRALPGGALTELIMTAWNGGNLANVPLLLAPSLVWAVLGVLAARAFFRWEPRP